VHALHTFISHFETFQESRVDCFPKVSLNRIPAESCGRLFEASVLQKRSDLSPNFTSRGLVLICRRGTYDRDTKKVDTPSKLKNLKVLPRLQSVRLTQLT
jgi:hypothetical protein